MKSTTIAKMKDTLLGRKAELEDELSRLTREIKELNSDQEDEHGGLGNHFADDGSSLEEQERLATIEADFREQLGQVDKALERIDSDSYGTCARCGRKIPYQRLKALPFASHCIDCQEHLERQAELFGTVSN